MKQATQGWKVDARKRIRRSALVIVICGYHTQSAQGVAPEINIARGESVPYYLLARS